MRSCRPSLVDAYSKLIINSVSGTSAFQQVAAAEALNGPQDSVDAMAAEFRARRDLVVEGLNRIPGVRAGCRRARSTPSPTSAALA